MREQFKRQNQPEYLTLMDEYNKLGDELKNTTRSKLAEKFEVTVHALAAINILSLDEMRMLKDLLEDRKQTMKKRLELRRYLQP